MNIADWRQRWITVRNTSQAYYASVTASLEIGKSRNHILALDGVRAIACLAVLWFHMNLLARNYGLWNPMHGIHSIYGAIADFGESGVILFFLLSGFLLFLPYVKTLVFDGNWPSVRRFYLRRIFRIIPGYYVALFLIILFFHPEFLHGDHRQQLWQFLTFTMSSGLSQVIDGPFWTLAVEFQFYMLLPIIAWLFSLIVCRGSQERRLTKLTLCLCAMIIWGLLTRYWGLFIADTPQLDFLIPHQVSDILKPLLYGDTGKYFEVFAVGMLISMLFVYTQQTIRGKQWGRSIQRWSPWLFLTGIFILFVLSLLHFYMITIDAYQNANPYHVFAFLDPDMAFLRNAWSMWQASGYAICYGTCIVALLFGPSLLKRPFEWSVLRWIGMISFSLYMWHLPFLFLFVNVIRPQFQGWHNNGIVAYYALYCWVLFLIIPLALTFYRWIEMPGMRLGEAIIRVIMQPQRRTSQSPASAAVAGSFQVLKLQRINQPEPAIVNIATIPSPANRTGQSGPRSFRRTHMQSLAANSEPAITTWPCGHQSWPGATSCYICGRQTNN